MGRWRPASLLLHRIAAASKSLTPNASLPSKRLHLSQPSRPTYRFLSLRAFSAVPSRVSVYANEFDYGDPYSGQNYGLGVEEDEDTGKIPVKAYFLCTRFAISALSINSKMAFHYSLVYPVGSFFIVALCSKQLSVQANEFAFKYTKGSSFT